VNDCKTDVFEASLDTKICDRKSAMIYDLHGVVSFEWVASFDGLWPFWQPTTAYKHIMLYVIDVFASGK